MAYDETNRYKISARLGLNSGSVTGKIIIFIIVVAIILGSVVYFSPVFKLKVGQSSNTALASVYQVINGFNESIISTKNALVNYVHLERKYRELQQENEVLKSREIMHMRIFNENELLKKTFKYSTNQTKKILSTEILTQSLGGYIESARIPVGRSSGVRENDVVVTGEQLVGRIEEVGETHSQVILITSPSAKLPVVFT